MTQRAFEQAFGAAENGLTQKPQRTVALGYGARQLPFNYDPNQFQVVAPRYSDIARLGRGLHHALDVPQLRRASKKSLNRRAV